MDLGLSVNWAGWNVGASSPEEYGDLFAWGETSPKSGDYTKSTYKYYNGTLNMSTCYVNIGNNISNTRYDAAYANWGGSWRMPSLEEFVELRDKCEWEWIIYKGVNGMKVTGPNGNSIFLPAAGGIYKSLDNQGVEGGYWSSSLLKGNSIGSWGMGFDSNGSSVDGYYREGGQSVRPVKAR